MWQQKLTVAILQSEEQVRCGEEQWFKSGQRLNGPGVMTGQLC